MKDKNGGLELWSDGKLEERRPPARRCVRRGHLFGVHALACSGNEQKGNMLKHGHQTFTRRLFGVHASACSGSEPKENMLKHAHPTVTPRLFGVHALACSGSEPKGNMLKHGHQTSLIGFRLSRVFSPLGFIHKWLKSRLVSENFRDSRRKHTPPPSQSAECRLRSAELEAVFL
jgi:hypothetical protein